MPERGILACLMIIPESLFRQQCSGHYIMSFFINQMYLWNGWRCWKVEVVTFSTGPSAYPTFNTIPGYIIILMHGYAPVESIYHIDQITMWPWTGSISNGFWWFWCHWKVEIQGSPTTPNSSKSVKYWPLSWPYYGLSNVVYRFDRCIIDPASIRWWDGPGLNWF